MSSPLRAPRLLETLREGLCLFEFLALLISWPWLKRAHTKINKRRTILVIPGYTASDKTTWCLRLFLRQLGYRAEGWQQGRNHGRVEQLLPALEQRLLAISHRDGEAPVLLGWSLGGFLARELARTLPQHVSQVVTLGTPVIGGPKYTIVARHYRRWGYCLDELEQTIALRNQQAFSMPVIALYSRYDGIVHWRACLDQLTTTTHYPVTATHIGLVGSPWVFIKIARLLGDH
ncbi:esterase/lipase family protein [Corallincola spongiicola]|uniref:Alpha/beta hydrolase n=1 Tax=Corallincola spongiicola TaxID=2520508 RepID=A0ABY1WNX9_9GAMM|nr:alpha/beta fold hydrolase [Corallincola spongiicola]TAA45788.1 alpha/beta hydrolase [Corallincola spongiicola]